MNTSSLHSARDAFVAARDFLLDHRADLATAVHGFRWPKLERFNWALEYFDPMAQGNDARALWIVDENGGDQKRSFRQMSDRSAQVANFLRKQGVKRGDRIVLMLGNEIALWECTLAAFKLGAVVIPATALLTRSDLRDRLDRGRARHVIAAAAQTAKFADLPATTRASASAEWSLDGIHSKRPTKNPKHSSPTGTRKLRLRCYCISPRARLRNRSWCCTRTKATRSDTCPPCSGSLSSRATYTSTFHRPVGPNMRGAASLRPGMPVHACSFTMSRASTRPVLLSNIECYGVTTLCASPTVWRMLIQPIHVMFSPNRHLNAKVRVFVDWAVEVFAKLTSGWLIRPPEIQSGS
jgi:acetyl-CoA synthetase